MAFSEERLFMSSWSFCLGSRTSTRFRSPTTFVFSVFFFPFSSPPAAELALSSWDFSIEASVFFFVPPMSIHLTYRRLCGELSLLSSNDEGVANKGCHGADEIAHVGPTDQARNRTDVLQAVGTKVHEGHRDQQPDQVGSEPCFQERRRALHPRGDLLHEERPD